jgi:CCR4-NOT transcription complex subunit 3
LALSRALKRSLSLPSRARASPLLRWRCRRPRQYTPQNAFPTPATFPQLPSAVFENPAIFSKFDTDTLFFIFYYQQGTYQQYTAPPLPFSTSLSLPRSGVSARTNLRAHDDTDKELAWYVVVMVVVRYLAARELKKQLWRYHKKYLTWFQRHEEPKEITNDYEQVDHLLSLSLSFSLLFSSSSFSLALT